MKALITGATGFVGQYLSRELKENGYEVWGGTRKCPPCFHTEEKMVALNLSEIHSINQVIEDVRPDVVFHLSGQSSVKYSWDNIGETYQSNVMETINLLEAIKCSPYKDRIRLITIGSSEEYGSGASSPIDEEAKPDPVNPYGVSKYTVGKLSQMYSKLHDLDIIHARAFNHIGPGQSLGFVTSDFAKQIAEIENGLANPAISVGDLSSQRDFTDVRDIVRAYRLLNEKGIKGNVYNVCSGTPVRIQLILDILVSFSGVPINVVVDKEKFRPADIKEYYGSNQKIIACTGWSPIISIHDSLQDIYSYWKNEDKS